MYYAPALYPVGLENNKNNDLNDSDGTVFLEGYSLQKHHCTDDVWSSQHPGGIGIRCSPWFM